MKIKANFLSLTFKIIGCFVILTVLTLKVFHISNVPITEVIAGVLAIEALVLPIDISKIKEAKST